MSGGGQGVSAGGGGQFGGMPLGNGMGQGTIPGRPPMMGGQPGQRPPMMYPGGPGGREGHYPAPMPGTGGPDPTMGGQDMRNPTLGGVKYPMPHGQLPEDYLRMMQMQQQRQQQGLLGQPTMQAGGGLPPGVSMGMSPPKVGQNPTETAQLMAQYGMPR